MKRLILITLFIASINCIANAQYAVIKVSGKIKDGSGNYIKPGRILKSIEGLSWSSINDKLFVLEVGKGEKIYSPLKSLVKGTVSNPSSPNSQTINELTNLLSSSLGMESKSASLSGRSELIAKIPEALRADPKSNGKIIIEKENKYLFDQVSFPQTNGNIFFIQIASPRQTPIVRSLQTRGDTLFINSDDLATESMLLETKYTLGYFNRTTNQSSLVTSFVPYFDLTNEMEDVISNFIIAYQASELKKEAVRDSIYQSIYANSGKPNGILFSKLFNQYWESKGIASTNSKEVPGTGAIFDQADFNRVTRFSASIDVMRSELPTNFSLRQYAPPIGYQSKYGSCTAWSTAYAARTIAFAVQHNYNVNNQYEKIKINSFAADFIYNNLNKSGDCSKGTSITEALRFMKERGNILKVTEFFVCGKTYGPSDLSAAENYKIKDFNRLNGENIDKAKLIQSMKAELANKHALPFGMHLPNSFMEVGQSGIWYPTAAERSKVALVKLRQASYNGHAMCVIGYNDSINNGSFEVMNSWGSWMGNKGFYWISYDDFYDFSMDVFALTDFELNNLEVVTPAKTISQVNVKPVLDLKKDEPKVVVVDEIVMPKPRLKGKMEFMLLKPDNSYESVGFSKAMVGSRGQTVENDADKSAYANFILAKPFYSGNKYKIKLNMAQPAYVYIVGIDKQKNYTLFPQEKLNESALINIKNATLLLPNETSHYTLDNVVGKEKMCVLISKSPIDLNALNKKSSTSEFNLYQTVSASLGQRLIEVKNNETNKLDFDNEVNDNHVLAFFIEMNHL